MPHTAVRFGAGSASSRSSVLSELRSAIAAGKVAGLKKPELPTASGRTSEPAAKPSNARGVDPIAFDEWASCAGGNSIG